MASHWTSRAAAQYKIDSIDMERIQEFDGIDFDSGEPLLASILNLYLEIAPKYLTQILFYFETLNVEEIHKIAHNLKSSSANVGADKLALLCRNLELNTEPANDVSPAALKTAVEQIVVEFPKVKDQITLLAQLSKDNRQ